MRFEWDPRKAKANVRLHGVSFEEAVTAFDDPGGRMEFDRLHSDSEDRFWILARSDKIDHLLFRSVIVARMSFVLFPHVRLLVARSWIT